MPVRNNEKKQLRLVLSYEEMNRLTELAKEKNLTKTAFLRYLLNDYLDKKQKEETLVDVFKQQNKKLETALINLTQAQQNTQLSVERMERSLPAPEKKAKSW